MKGKEAYFNWKTILALLLALAAYHFQISGGPWILPVIFLAGACIFLWVPWATIGKPRRIKNKEWDPVTHEEFQKLMEKAEDSLRISHSISRRIGFLIGVIIAGFFLWPFITQLIKDKAVLWGIFDAVVLSMVVLISGIVKVWTPPSLDRKAVVLYDVLKEIEKLEGLTVTPQLLVGTTKKGKQVPVDANLMARPEKAPDWLKGIQFQVSVNKVQNKEYPYFYSVIILEPKTLRKVLGIKLSSYTKKKYDALKEKCGIKDEKLTVEVQPMKDVDVIIIRQKTTKTSGYHTSDSRVREILHESLKLLECLTKEKWQS